MTRTLAQFRCLPIARDKSGYSEMEISGTDGQPGKEIEVVEAASITRKTPKELGFQDRPAKR